jgi:VanZ family protein
MLPLRFPRMWLVLGWTFVVLALFACLAPSNTPVLHEVFRFNDKVEHAVGYLCLTLWFVGIYPRSHYARIAVALFAMGVTVEYLQGWMSLGRSRDPYDVMANTVGIAIGMSLALALFGGWAQSVEKFVFRRER